MKNQAVCPTCQTSLSRWHYFTTGTIHFRCRSCGARFRFTSQGWAVLAAGIALQLLLFTLYCLQILAPQVTLVLLLLVCAVGIWLLPCLTPVQAGNPAPDQKP